METGSSGRPDRNRAYGHSNTTTDNLWAARSVSTTKSSESISNAHSKEFMALQQHTTHLFEKYEQLSAEIMNNTTK